MPTEARRRNIAARARRIGCVAEALTRLEKSGASDPDYSTLAAAFRDRERVKLTLVITTINSWNRFAVGFRSQHPID